MAKTQEAQFSYTVQDEIGVKAAITQYLLIDPTMTVTQLAALWQSNAVLIDPCISGEILHGKAELVLLPSGLKGSPGSGSRVEQTGLFTFANATNPRSFGMDFPSWADSKISGGHIPLTDTDVAALVAALDTPLTLSEFTTNQFLVLSTLRQTAITFRKRRRLEAKLTTEVG